MTGGTTTPPTTMEMMPARLLPCRKLHRPPPTPPPPSPELRPPPPPWPGLALPPPPWQVFKHHHEEATGRTSSIGQHTLCLDAKGNVLNDPLFRTQVRLRMGGGGGGWHNVEGKGVWRRLRSVCRVGWEWGGRPVPVQPWLSW